MEDEHFAMFQRLGDLVGEAEDLNWDIAHMLQTGRSEVGIATAIGVWVRKADIFLADLMAMPDNDIFQVAFANSMGRFLHFKNVLGLYRSRIMQQRGILGLGDD